MTEKAIDRLIGKYCKIVAQEPGEEKTYTIFGRLTNINYDKRLVEIESNPNTVYLSLDIIVVIKPK